MVQNFNFIQTFKNIQKIYKSLTQTLSIAADSDQLYLCIQINILKILPQEY